MSKKAQIKKFNATDCSFQSDAEAKSKNKDVDLSQVFTFYKLLLDSIVYVATQSEEEGLPDIDATMTSQLKNGEWEVHQKIKEVAQRINMKAIVTSYFEANLVSNIPISVLSSVLDDVDALVRDSADVKKRKRDSLKQAYQQQKSNASYLAEVWLLSVCNGKNMRDETPLGVSKGRRVTDPFEALKAAEELIAMLPAPVRVVPPEQPLSEEQTYIRELYAAYGDKEGVIGFCDVHLRQYDEYDEDIKERRIDYFAAESIRRGVSEMSSGRYNSQFDILKDETFAGVQNTARRTFVNGYERMLGVMEQAVLIQTKQYMLSQSPNWISNRIKSGICHFLVNENKLKWVK
jgi:hypothetical protein